MQSLPLPALRRCRVWVAAEPCCMPEEQGREEVVQGLCLCLFLLITRTSLTGNAMVNISDWPSALPDRTALD